MPMWSEHVEEAIGHQANLLEKTFDSMTDAVFILDAKVHPTIINCNKAASTIFGYGKEEMLGRTTAFLHVSDETLREFKSLLYPAADEGRLPFHLPEFRMRRKDGSILISEHSVNQLTNDKGERIGWVSIVRDITECRKAEEKLLYHASLLQNVSDAIIATDQNFKIKSWNKAAEKIYGWREDEVIGKRVKDVTKLEYPYDNEEEVLKHFLEKGYWKGEVVQKHKNGNTVYVYASVSLIKDSSGNPIGAVAVNRDITERKKAEEAFIDSEQRYRQLFEGISDAVMVYSPQEGFLDCNAITLQRLGYSYEEFRRLKAADIVHPDFHQLMKDNQQRIWAGEITIVESAHRCKDGGVIPVEVNARRIEYKGKPAILAVVRDITERKRAVEALRESEERYRQLVELSPDTIAVHSEGKIAFINTAGAKLLRAAKSEQLIGKPIMDFLHPDHREIVKERIRQMREGEKSAPLIEEKFIRLDGTEVDVEVAAIPFSYQNKPVIMAIARDITERKKAEEALRKSEEKYRSMIELAPDGIMTTNIKGMITLCNTAAARITGYSKDEIVGKHFSKLGFLRAEDLPKHLKLFSSVLRGKVPEPFEITWQRKDGTPSLAEVHISLMKEGGRTVGLQAIARDITERKEMEEKLRQYSENLEELVQKRTEELLESEKKYSVLAEIGSDGVAIAQDEKIVFQNQKGAEILGYSIDELIGFPFEKLAVEKYRQDAKERYTRIIRGETVPKLYEVELIAKNGEHVPFEVSSTLIHYQGRPADLVVMRDIRDRKRMEEERLRLEKLATIGELATMVAHDIRNPLTSIRNACFYIKKNCPSRANAGCKTALEMLDIIEQETVFASDIINDLLDYATKTPLQKERQSINKLIEDSLTGGAIPKNIEVERNFAEKAIANVDGKQLERVFLNLTKNAVQAMPNGGKLTIMTSEMEDHIEITFTDTGAGIPKENMSKIFQPFFSTKAKGIGIGLAICKKIVEQHGGTIDFKSKVGQGTTFIIKLPKMEDENNQ